MKKVILWKCPHCGSQHALVSLERKGSKRSLGVHCDDSGRLAHTRFVPLPQSTVDAMDENDPDLQNLPTFVTAPAKREAEAKNNLGLVLMFPTPGQQVERNVELPRAQVEPSEMAGVDSLIAAQIASDDIQAKRILGEIEQCKQAFQEVQADIERLVTKRNYLDKHERELRAELRKYYTQPLDFGYKPDVSIP